MKKIVIFCGGRGSQHIVREALRAKNVEISLLVNAYDDGLSTGRLREIIPGMLGPSDFRKNLSYLLRLYSPMQLSLQKLIEYRFPLDFGLDGLERLESYLDGDLTVMPEMWQKIYLTVDDHKKKKIRFFLEHFCSYLRKNEILFDFADTSFGNIIFAGIYLDSGNNFNLSSSILANLVDAEGRLINVSKGENRTLTALKADGQILSRESEVVGPQSKEPILDIFFTSGPISSETIKDIEILSAREKNDFLRDNSLQCEISDECRSAIMEADAIIYGPGTQHSSLFPSYIIAKNEIKKSKAHKILVTNLNYDHDIQGFSVNDLVDRVLYYLDDPYNSNNSITHVLANKPSVIEEDSIVFRGGDLDNQESNILHGAEVIKEAFFNPSNIRIHSGYAIFSKCVEIIESKSNKHLSEKTLEIFIDLYKRSVLMETIIREITEIDWRLYVDRVVITLNRSEEITDLDLPDFIELRQINLSGVEPQTYITSSWLTETKIDYLVTLTGDGEYRIRDIINLLKVGNDLKVGAVLGTRSQSRHQLSTSLRFAYGDGLLMRIASKCGAFLLTFIFLLRFGVMFSDPLTGLVVFRRDGLNDEFKSRMVGGLRGSSSAIVRFLLSCKVDVCEVPVSYRTYPHFTDALWRLRRGFNNLKALIG